MARKLTRILTVDDEPSICELLEEYLSLQGYAVRTESDGKKAISSFRAFKPHMILLDIQMPGVSGLDVLKEIKRIDDAAGVIMISAFGDSETIKEAMDMGADYYLQKPIEFQSLMEYLEAWQNSG